MEVGPRTTRTKRNANHDKVNTQQREALELIG